MNNCTIKKISPFWVIFAGIALPLSASMAEPYRGILGSCKISPLIEYIQPVTEFREDEYINISSDYADTDEATANLLGNIYLLRGDETVTASALALDRINNILTGEKQLIRYSTPNSVVESQSIQSHLNEKEHLANDAVYYFHDMSAQGKAASVNSYQEKKQAVLKQATYSTCPSGGETWGLSSNNLVLDRNTGRGVAKNAYFALFGVPVLYTPYMSFPIDDRRQSGFLFPVISMDGDGGFSLRTPYYLNIAPNFDMTVTPGFYTKRGVILGVEARYLNTWQSSVFSIEFLPNDRDFKRQESLKYKEEIDRALAEERIPYYKRRSEDRWSVFYEQFLNFTPKFSGHILFQQVSDEDYVKDLDDAIGLLSKTNLERFAKFTYEEDNWSVMLNFQHFQVIDRDVIPQDPYARMPQLTFSGNWETSNGFHYGIDAEAVRFTTSVNPRQSIRPERGDRFDIMPYISYRFERSWGYIEPRVALRFTSYDLKYKHHQVSQGFSPDEIKSFENVLKNNKRHFNRSLPIFSIDSGLFFERETHFSKLFGGGDFIQTLEPRLFYLYVPYRKQDHIPIFDSGVRTPSYSELFRHNSFKGADRQSDANQLTVALTSRLIEAETGKEQFILSLGQIHYFTEPLVTLGNDREKYNDCLKRKYENEENWNIRCKRNDKSEWFVENEIFFTKDVSTKMTWHWSPNIKKTTRIAFDLRYQPTSRQVFNVGHRFSRSISDPDNPTHQLDFTSFWELNQNWSFVARYNYALDEHALSDSYLGFEYNDCCVTTRIAARYYREHVSNKEKKWKAYLQIELKGLGNFGQDTMALWSDTITGYQPTSR